jgi:hypothetical protein
MSLNMLIEFGDAFDYTGATSACGAGERDSGVSNSSLGRIVRRGGSIQVTVSRILVKARSSHRQHRAKRGRSPTSSRAGRIQEPPCRLVQSGGIRFDNQAVVHGVLSFCLHPR